MKGVSPLLFTTLLTSLWLSSGSVLSNISSWPIPHLIIHMETQIGWLKLGSSIPLDGLPYNAECYCVTEVLLTSCPASQSSSPKLLSSVYPPSGTSVGGTGVGGSVGFGSYWKGRKWLEMKAEVLQLKSGWTTSPKNRRNTGIRIKDIEELWSKFLHNHLGKKEVSRSSVLIY